MGKTLKSYGLIVLACVPYAVSFNWFYAANHLTCGGFTGLGQIVHAFCPNIGVGAVIAALNVPLFLLGWRRCGVQFLLKSLCAMAVSSALIDALGAAYTFAPMEPLLAALYGGVTMGAALGFLLREEATTGGTELGARLLKFPFPHLPIGRLCLAIDLAVIALYALVFRNAESALYGTASLYVSTAVIDMVVYGGREAKLAYIISPAQETIRKALLEEGVGVTVLRAQGGYSGEDSPVLLCAIRRREITAVKRLVCETDPAAFFIVCDAREVLGEGFGEYRKDDI